MISHSRRLVLPGASGSIRTPRKMSGSAINRMEELIVAISTPSVVLDNAIHLYRGFRTAIAARACRSTLHHFP
ncbi:hypothetical protein GCM10017566_73630 [Amycolatopsis bartoniae]|uniref:Uncharacterized protein n=1 Tax=Amycolatopsis bartoniae TaxID=941986 RepID=A0A8H9J121_9PSEU|nr:hypothetical protein GCM10017566_73630 [Amycolatopsis bartoniae]